MQPGDAMGTPDPPPASAGGPPDLPAVPAIPEAALAEVRFDERGLVPVVVQDAATGEVLMLAHADRAALESTCRTGRATFWSRSRGRAWQKGETSGNALHVIALGLDCDGDAVLYRVRPAGPACHTGEPSCFFRGWPEGAEGRAQGGASEPAGAVTWVRVATGEGGSPDALPHVIERVLEARRGSDDPASYTALLWRRGEDYVAGKVTEEAAEVVDAARSRAPSDLAEEAADLVFHLLALLRMKGVAWADVLEVLRARRAGHGRGARD